MLRALFGLIAGIALWAAVFTYTGGDQGASISLGALAAITIWFWAWGRISQPGVEQYETAVRSAMREEN